MQFRPRNPAPLLNQNEGVKVIEGYGSLRKENGDVYVQAGVNEFTMQREYVVSLIEGLVIQLSEDELKQVVATCIEVAVSIGMQNSEDE